MTTNKAGQASLKNTGMKDASADMSSVIKGRDLRVQASAKDYAHFAKYLNAKTLSKNLTMKPKSKEKS